MLLRAMSVALGVWIWAPVGEARACSVPCETWFLPAGGVVPANLVAVRWRTMQGDKGTLLVTEVLPDGRASEVPMTVEQRDYRWWEGRFSRPLVVGATYVVSVESWCYDPSKPHTDAVHLVAGPEAPLPTKLGRVTVSGAFRAMCEVQTNNGACWSTADVSARQVTLELSDEAEPWREALDFQWGTTGDGWIAGLPHLAENGHEFDPETGYDRFSFTAYALCGSPESGQYAGNPEGTHEVVASATLPGTEVELETRPVDVALLCERDETPAPTCLAVPGSGCAAGGFGAAGGGFLWSALWLGVRARRSLGVRRGPPDDGRAPSVR